MKDVTVSGTFAPAFAGLHDAFAANFADHGEVGAAVAVFHDGKLVADLHGGHADPARSRPWQADTVVNVWSSTKGIQATCFAMAVDRGLVAYDQPVADFWPEFGQAGKAGVTVGQLLSHQAGLCGFTTPASADDVLAGPAAAARLAAQAPLWEPGTANGYHALTIGVLGTELFRRIEGRSIRQFVAEELAGPLDLHLTIGLPAHRDAARADLIAPDSPLASDPSALTQPQILALGNPAIDVAMAGTAAWRAADLPSANGHANARSLATVYARLIDRTDPLVRPETLAEATRPRATGEDLVLRLPCQWGAGFLRNSEGVYGPSGAAFGHSGYGGSFAFGDPANGLAMAYTMNRMGANLRDDPRAMALIGAAYAAIKTR